MKSSSLNMDIACICFNLMHKSRAVSHAIRKLELNTIYDAYSNKSPVVYKQFMRGLRPCLFRGWFGKTFFYDT